MSIKQAVWVELTGSDLGSVDRFEFLHDCRNRGTIPGDRFKKGKRAKGVRTAIKIATNLKSDKICFYFRKNCDSEALTRFSVNICHVGVIPRVSEDTD